MVQVKGSESSLWKTQHGRISLSNLPSPYSSFLHVCLCRDPLHFACGLSVAFLKQNPKRLIYQIETWEPDAVVKACWLKGTEKALS